MGKPNEVEVGFNQVGRNNWCEGQDTSGCDDVAEVESDQEGDGPTNVEVAGEEGLLVEELGGNARSMHGELLQSSQGNSGQVSDPRVVKPKSFKQIFSLKYSKIFLKTVKIIPVGKHVP